MVAASSHLRFGAGDEDSKPDQGRKFFASDSIVNRNVLWLTQAIEHNCFWWWAQTESIRTLSELPFRIDFLFVGKILTILKNLGEYKSDNS